MSFILEIEKAASRLRHDLKLAQLPELKLLCGLLFFDSVVSQHSVRLESYLREFIPSLAIVADKSNHLEFLPDETESLERLIDFLKIQSPGVVSQEDMNRFSGLVNKIKISSEDSPHLTSASGSSVGITCLFVERYPDLNLPPRGRILNMTVTASKISSKAKEDDVVVRNPVSEPDDRFLAQARDSIKVARAFLETRYGLSHKKHYRFDYAVDSSGARFTGDSLGVAFAIGAIAALSRTETFRDKLSVSPYVAFSGALSADGKLCPVDSDALKLKTYRAFHSYLNLLLIPREHLPYAQTQVLALEKQHPGRKLDLAGAETIEAVANDPRLLLVERSSAAAYVARKAWKAKRSVWVEVPALLVLLALLFYLVVPARYMPWFDDNPAYFSINSEKSRIEVYNANEQQLWNVTYPGRLHTGEKRTFPNYVYDLQGDGKNEVFYIPCTYDSSDARDWLHVYSYKGERLFKQYCPILGEYPHDDSSTLYNTGSIFIAELQDEAIIITIVDQENPARSHYRFWNSAGDSLGWYINSGHGIFDEALDINGDGNKELLFMVFNNRMKCCALLILRPDSMYGVSPPYQYTDFDLSWVKRGNQMAYILFPKTDLGEIDLESLLNSGSSEGISMESDSVLKIPIVESIQGYQNATIIYYLNKRLRVYRVVRSDRFEKRRNDLVREGKLPLVNWTEYQAALRDTVTYWTDSGWVTEGQLRAAENH